MSVTFTTQYSIGKRTFINTNTNEKNTNDRSDCENVLDSEGSVSEEILTICGLLIIKILTLRAPH